MCVLDVLIAKK